MLTSSDTTNLIINNFIYPTLSKTQKQDDCLIEMGKNHTFTPDCVTRGKVKASLKTSGFLLWGIRMSVFICEQKHVIYF